MEQDQQRRQAGCSSQAVIASRVDRRLRVHRATVIGTGQTARLVAETVLAEWRDWLTKHGYDTKILDIRATELVDRVNEYEEGSEEFRRLVRANDGRDVMRGFILRWINDRIAKTNPALLADRSLPRYFTGR